jgi:hypothetical protein
MASHTKRQQSLKLTNCVTVYLISDQHIGHLLNRDLLMSYVDFAKKFLGACGINPKAATIPINVSLNA